MNKPFEILCPNCLEWSKFCLLSEGDATETTELSEKDVITDIGILKSQLNTLGKIPTQGAIQCSSPSWICPSRFEVLLFKGDITELYDLSLPGNIYEKPKIFRVYQNRNDHLSRLTDAAGNYYYAILFCRERVHREKHILPDHLFDEQLLQNTLRGISGQIRKPATLFAARVFNLTPQEQQNYPHLKTGQQQGNDFVCWIPIEAYNEKGVFPPHNFHRACEAIRYFERDFLSWKLRFQFTQWKAKCPWLQNKLCGGIAPPCKQEPVNWESCPRYLNERYKLGLCYKSDLDNVKEIYESWQKDNLKDAVQEKKCTIYDFLEYLFPVIIHNHLIAVAFTGQMGSQCLDAANGRTMVEEVIKKEKEKIHKAKEEKIKEIVEKAQDDTHREVDTAIVQSRAQEKIGILDAIYSDFRVRLNAGSSECDTECCDKQDLQNKFQNNIESIISLASTRYIHLRARREDLFRREMAQYARQMARNKMPAEQAIAALLSPMLDFWAFNFAFFIKAPLIDCRNIEYMICKYNIESSSPRLEPAPVPVLYDKSELWLRYPDHIICDFSEDTPLKNNRAKCDHPFRKVLSTFYTILKEKHKIGMRASGEQLIVSVPYHQHNQLYLFIFSSRNTNNVSPLRPYAQGGISSLCGEMVFETCVLIMHELCIQYPDLLSPKDYNAGKKAAPRTIVEKKDCKTSSEHNFQRTVQKIVNIFR